VPLFQIGIGWGILLPFRSFSINKEQNLRAQDEGRGTRLGLFVENLISFKGRSHCGRTGLMTAFFPNWLS
jgi:hypothetical protein